MHLKTLTSSVDNVVLLSSGTLIPPRLITLSEGWSSHIFLELFPWAVPILPSFGSGIAVGLLPVLVSILAAAILGSDLYSSKRGANTSCSIPKGIPQRVLSKTSRGKIQWFIMLAHPKLMNCNIVPPTLSTSPNRSSTQRIFTYCIFPDGSAGSTNPPTFWGSASPVLGRHLQLAIPFLVMKGIFLGQHCYQPQRPSFGNRRGTHHTHDSSNWLRTALNYRKPIIRIVILHSGK